MGDHQRVILRDLGRIVHVPGLMAFASLPVCIYFNEVFAIGPFLWTGVVAVTFGQILFWWFRRSGDAYLFDAVITAALGWLVVPFFGALPFLQIASHSAGAPTLLAFREPLNSLFEAFSGFTGTGLTVALRPSELPHSLQWWRSLMEWVGGVGVIVLMLTILKPTMGAHNLYLSEAREEKILPTVASTVRAIWWIYLLYTAASVVLLRVAGMPTWWEAINHGMTGIATGGFSITDDSMAGYGRSVRLVLIPVMVAGAISFTAHYRALREGRVRALWQDAQHFCLWIVLGGGALLLLLENRWFGGSFQWIDSSFHWTSALCTAGFQAADLQEWSPTAKLLLTMGMIIGGAAGSTVGGIKQARLAVLCKGMVWRLRRTYKRPHEVVRYEWDGKGLKESEADYMVQTAAVLSVLWILMLWIGVLLLIHFAPPRFNLEDVIFEVASAQGNVGLSTGITHPALEWPGKLILMAAMWIGRLEIVPVIFVFSALLRRLGKFRS